MRLSRLYAPTIKEAPADAETISHKLTMRAGFIRRLTSGIYTFLPPGLKILNKIAGIIREEMLRAGAQEILMPMVQPADLWRESGRFDVYGKELLRFIDRHDREYCLGPTHEEIVVDLVRHELKSWRQLPVNLFQIQGKFRDEIRPRFGLMRGREFLMKDGYSFDRDEKGAEATYQAMYDAYTRAFTRMGLKFRAVEADSGPIGGGFSHEFMVLADAGEDTIAVCDTCEYAANLEKAVSKTATVPCSGHCDPLEEVPTPGKKSVAEIAAFLKVKPEQVVKTLVYMADGKPAAALVRGDRELNEVKFKNLLGAVNLELATPEQIKALTHADTGFAGPVGIAAPVYADEELLSAQGYVAGANKTDVHIRNLSLVRDVKLAQTADLRQVAQGDPCPRCTGRLGFTKGIEVGHVFKLGTKYSKALRATFLDENGAETPLVMGCYGIGVSRILAASIEQNNDEFGALFPPSIASEEVLVVHLAGKGDDESAKTAESIYQKLLAGGIDAALDDRDERPGVKFKDADLVGRPIQLVIGGKSLARGVVEAKDRRSGEKTELPLDAFDSAFEAFRRKVHEGWTLARG